MILQCVHTEGLFWDWVRAFHLAFSTYFLTSQKIAMLRPWSPRETSLQAAYVVPGGVAPVMLFEDVTSVSITLTPKDYPGGGLGLSVHPAW